MCLCCQNRGCCGDFACHGIRRPKADGMFYFFVPLPFLTTK